MRIFALISLFAVITFLFKCSSAPGEVLFFDVPLVCGAAPEIGCGSRIKPLFIELAKQSEVKEVWTNREGTVLAVKCKAGEVQNFDKIFKKHKIEAKPITDKTITDSLIVSMASEQNWLKGTAVDSLSLYEAGVIASTMSDFAKEAKLINGKEHQNIHKDLESYFKKELVKVRTEEELTSEACQVEWKNNGFNIYKKHIGSERAEKVKLYFEENEITIMKQESCCSAEEDKCCEKKEDKMVETSTITCPYCGHKKLEKLPTDVCQIRYTCEHCKKDIFPKTGDCCVFCSYGDHKCPSKQES